MSAGCTGCQHATSLRTSSTKRSCTQRRTIALQPSRGCEHDAAPNACPYQGCGALHLAAAFGALQCVRLLIAAGADIERTNGLNGDNALRWAEYVLARERPGDTGVAAVRDLLRSLGSH